MTHPIRNGEAVKYIGKLVAQLKDALIQIELLEQQVKELKSTKKDLEEVIIPDAMTEIGVQQIQLMTNEVVTVKPFYFARLIPETNNQFFHWLRENGFGGLIKEKLEVLPPSELIEIIVNLLNEMNIQFEQGSTIHWKTLESWFKESIEAGVDLPMDLFSNYIGRKAKVK